MYLPSQITQKMHQSDSHNLSKKNQDSREYKRNNNMSPKKIPKKLPKKRIDPL